MYGQRRSSNLPGSVSSKSCPPFCTRLDKTSVEFRVEDALALAQATNNVSLTLVFG
jgi:hypothetical protein